MENSARTSASTTRPAGSTRCATTACARRFAASTTTATARKSARAWPAWLAAGQAPAVHPTLPALITRNNYIEHKIYINIFSSKIRFRYKISTSLQQIHTLCVFRVLECLCVCLFDQCADPCSSSLVSCGSNALCSVSNHQVGHYLQIYPSFVDIYIFAPWSFYAFFFKRPPRHRLN